MKLRLLPLLVILAMPAAFTPKSIAQTTAASQIRKEITRLEKDLKGLSLSDKDFSNVVSMTTDALKGASAALDAGQIYLALEKLDQANNLLRGTARIANRGEAEKEGLPAFEAQYKKLSLHLTALDKETHARDWSHAPLAVRALAEAAQGRAIPLLEGGLGFATAKGPRQIGRASCRERV